MGPTWDPDVGIHTPGVESDEIPCRVASFLLHIIEKRSWAYSEWTHKWPGAFASTCSPVAAQAVAGSSRARDFWEVCTLAESSANAMPGLYTLWREAYWMDWPVNQLHFRFFAQCNFQAIPQIVAVFRRVFLQLGDTLPCEKTHKDLRAMETQEQASKESAPKRMYHRMTSHEASGGKRASDGKRARGHKVTALDSRGIHCVQVTDNSWYEEDPDMHRVPDGGWDKAFQAKGKPLNRSWSCDNVLDSTKSYVSKRPDDIKVSVSAAVALLYLHERRQLQLATHAWQTQALRPHHHPEMPMCRTCCTGGQCFRLSRPRGVVVLRHCLWKLCCPSLPCAACN